MVELNTLLIVSSIVGIVSTVVTVGFFLLIGVYVNTRNSKKEETEEQGAYIVPMGGPGGMGRMIVTQADVDRAKEAMAAAAQHSQHGPPEKPEACHVPGGYI